MDLVVLTADATMEAGLKAILGRPQSIGIRPIQVDVFAHPDHDSGVFTKGHLFLQPLAGAYQHALAILDREGTGQEHMSAEEIQAQIQARLTANGWAGRSAVVVIDPELEMWVWANSPHVAAALGWGNLNALQKWLRQEGWLGEGIQKPARPKEAMEAAMRVVRKAKSASVYKQIAREVGFATCIDPAFARLQGKLREWFPTEQ